MRLMEFMLGGDVIAHVSYMSGVCLSTMVALQMTSRSRWGLIFSDSGATNPITVDICKVYVV